MTSNAVWRGAVVVLATVLLAILLAIPPVRVKARPTRVSGVNHVQSVAVTLTNASRLSGGQEGEAK